MPGSVKWAKDPWPRKPWTLVVNEPTASVWLNGHTIKLLPKQLPSYEQASVASAWTQKFLFDLTKILTQIRENNLFS